MTRGKQAKSWAPYNPGDTITLKHQCGEEREVHTATIEVRRAENVVGFDVGSYRWRVVAVRCDGTLVMVDVDRFGFDQHGRVAPLPVADEVSP